jgi:ATP-binding cassette subfamily F protein uup
MLDRVSTIVLGLDGIGGMELFADYSQWEAWQRKQLSNEKRAAVSDAASPKKAAGPRKKLSFSESRELETIEQRIAEAEAQLLLKREALEDPAIASDGPRLLAAYSQITQAQNAIDQLYSRWTELEQKQGQ